MLITGEYLVMDGAQALAVPSMYGQSLEVKKGRGSEIKWKSFDAEGNEWFSAVISLFDFKCEKCSNQEVGERLTDILTESVRLNSDFLSKWTGLKVEAKSEFPLIWGLGSSSTLVHCMAQWADVDPFDLYARTFGGSGYDIACANAEGPIYFNLAADELHIEPAKFNPSYKNNLYFVYTGRKQSSREGIAHYENRKTEISDKTIKTVSSITQALVESRDLQDANKLIDEHEKVLSQVLDLPTVKQEKFNDFWGSIKSLGAWGGDFVLATSDRDDSETKSYFRDKGLETVLKWDEIVYQQS